MTFIRNLKSAGAVAALAFGVQGAAAQELVLRTVTPFDAGNPLSKPIVLLKEVVERETNGRVEIKILGGPEVIPSLEQFDGLRNGVVDILQGPVPYYVGAVPETFALLYTNQTSAEMRDSGLYQRMAELHDEKVDLHQWAITSGQPGTAFRFYLKEPVETADFTGLKIRVAASTAAIVTALGGTPVSIPFADVYTAMERGVADGFGSTYTGIVEPGFPEVFDYVLQEPFYTLSGPILIRNDVWAGIPDDLKQELDRIAPIYEQIFADFTAQSLAKEDEALRAAGIEFIELPAGEKEKFSSTVLGIGWDAYAKIDPEGVNDLRALATK